MRANSCQSADEAMLGAAAGDSAREGAAAPRVLTVSEGLGRQEGRRHLDACRASKAANGQNEADCPRGASGPPQFSDERAALGERSKQGTALKP